VNLQSPPKIVVLGMMARHPVAGVIWQTVHYLAGLKRLGFDVYYVEAHANNPSMFTYTPEEDGSPRAAAFIASVMNRFGFAGKWAFHALHWDGKVYGTTPGELSRLYESAGAIINLLGSTMPTPEMRKTGRLVYLESDPVIPEIRLSEGDPGTIEFLRAHDAFFTFAENYGRPDCGLPPTDLFTFKPTRQPVVLDFWEPYGAGSGELFTTIASWRQGGRDVCFNGEMYYWSKHLEFLKVLDLPQLTGAEFELALNRYQPDERALLEEHGWRVCDALDFSTGVDAYRDYIGGSRAEFTVAKDQNVRLRSGWFSDRSATYLAAGRPVITQETGFSNVLPAGCGLIGFSTVEEAAEAVREVNADYQRHSRAASEIAREFFSYEAVLKPLLAEIGL
jgi:hypothetical protein